MKELVRFGNAALANTKKTGTLKRDNDGYYDLLIGGLNTINSVGEYYSIEGVKELFLESGLLQRRIQRGRLRGEYGHPKQQPGESVKSYISRTMKIDEDKVSTFFREVYLDFDDCFDLNGNKVIGIRAKLKPYGPYAKCLQDALDDPYQNVCFSIRAFTKDSSYGGMIKRYLKTIVTWDQVGDPGIAFAEKYSTPSLESDNSVMLPEATLIGYANNEDKSAAGLALENGGLTFNDVVSAFGWSSNDRPSSLKW